MWEKLERRRKADNLVMDYLTINEFIRLFNISRRTFYNWKKRGLKVVKVGNRVYIRKKELEDFMNKQVVSAYGRER